MKLEHYLASREPPLSPAAFARVIERDKSTVTRLCNGERRPDPETMQRILDATNGVVTPNDFFSITKSAKAKSKGGTPCPGSAQNAARSSRK